jgi:hypothetical protein
MFGFAQLQFGQEAATALDPGPVAEATNAPDAASAPDAANAAAKEGYLARWLEIDTFSESLRYRSTANSGGFHPFQFGQHRELLDGNFKLDKEGKYKIHFHASSGRYFNWAFADMLNGQFTDLVPYAGKYRPASVSLLIGQALQADPNSPYPKGIESRGAYIYLRQLYLSATPVKQATFEYGSLGIERGESTEITTFDNDGYIAGGRLRLHDPEHLFFTEVDATFADLADALTPNFFARGNDLTQANYSQFMVRKKFGRFATSADLTLLRSTHTFREAGKVKVPELHIIDTARLEMYQRLNSTTLYGIHYPNGAGFAFTGSKTLYKRILLEGGYAHIDHFYGVYTGDPFLIAVGFAWNSDSFMTGSKAFTRGSVKVAPGVAFFGFFSHEVSPYQFFITNHSTAEGGITFDFADLLHRTHVL